MPIDDLEICMIGWRPRIREQEHVGQGQNTESRGRSAAGADKTSLMGQHLHTRRPGMVQRVSKAGA